MKELTRLSCGCLADSKGEVIHPCSVHILENPCIFCSSRRGCKDKCQSRKIYEQESNHDKHNI